MSLPRRYCAVMAFISNTSRGDWLRPRAGHWATAGGVAGTGFEAYARILHPLPAHREDLTASEGWGVHPTVEHCAWTWAELGAQNGRHVHPLVQWVGLSGQEPPQGVELDGGWTVGPPEEGQLDGLVFAALTEHLGQATTTPDDLVAAVWNGWGDLNGGSASGSFVVGEPSEEQLRQLHEQAERRRLRNAAISDALSGPTFEWPGREFHLMSASLTLFAERDWLDTASVDVWPAAGHTPQMLWPEDRSWVLATEIDWDFTIVAGSRGLIDGVLEDPRFEAFAIADSDDLTWSSDAVNRFNLQY
jgi:hypothetical protein